MKFAQRTNKATESCGLVPAGASRGQRAPAGARRPTVVWSKLLDSDRLLTPGSSKRRAKIIIVK